MISALRFWGGSEQARVAEVDAGFLDVLHDAADEHVGAVSEAVDVDFGGAAQIAVEQQRVVGRAPS